MKISYILAAFTLLSTYSYGQSKLKRKPIKTVQLESIGAILNLIYIKPSPVIRFEFIEEKTPQQIIIVGCKPLQETLKKISPVYDNSYVTIDRTPRRDISSMVLMNGGVIEKLNGGFSIFGSRNEPLMFVDGVKTRGQAILPAATVSEVEVIKGGIPAEFGDTNSGVILISSLGN